MVYVSSRSAAIAGGRAQTLQPWQRAVVVRVTGMSEELRTLLSKSRELERELVMVRRQIAHLPRSLHAASLTVLSCRAGDLAFCIPVQEVLEVVPSATLLPLADSGAWMRGTLNLGGELLPVIDVAARLGAAALPTSVNDSFAICLAGERKIALIARGVPRVVTGVGPILPVPLEFANASFVVGATDDDDEVILVVSALLLSNASGLSTEER